MSLATLLKADFERKLASYCAEHEPDVLAKCIEIAEQKIADALMVAKRSTLPTDSNTV